MPEPRPEDSDPNLLQQLKRDVLDRLPEVDEVEYVPDRATAQTLQVRFHPERLPGDVGPRPPKLEIEWYRGSPDDWFRVDYSEPNTGHHVGWHQDEDHPQLGTAHLQETQDGETRHRKKTFEHETPSLVLWEIVEELYDVVL